VRPGFGGRGPPAVLLHGLAGYGGEWADTASWLRERHRVVALDQRGHGGSTRVPATVAPDDFVGDVLAWLDELGLEQPCLVGRRSAG
jgi:pimeloyl-ACP methyl ester carboxylesterase